MGYPDEIIVVGAGIIGASIAYHLAKRGAKVLILDRVGPAAGATGKSFAWINANHVADEAYHRLRYQSLAEYHRLDKELNHALGVQWGGSLCFDIKDGAVDQRLARFQALGYPAEMIVHNQFRDLEPNYQTPPKRALRMPMEAAVQPIKACTALIDGAIGLGAQTFYGTDVKAIRRQDNKVVGIETDSGHLDAKMVILAAGIGVAGLLGDIDVDLPMANRPGLMLHSRPVEPVLDHVIWGDRIHIKQQDDRRLVIGEIFSDGEDERAQDAIAEDMLAEVRQCLPGIDIEVERTTIGMRPLPKDGMPVVGHVTSLEGLYLAVMHSGITLAPIVGRMAAEEVLDGVTFDALAPYRLDRFTKVS